MNRQSTKLAWFVIPTHDVEAAKLLCSDLIKAAPADARRQRHGGLYETPVPLTPNPA